MSDKNRKDEALDSANTAGVIEYTDEQVAEHERREKRAEQLNKKVEKVADKEGHEAPTPQDFEQAGVTPHVEEEKTHSRRKR